MSFLQRRVISTFIDTRIESITSLFIIILILISSVFFVQDLRNEETDTIVTSRESLGFVRSPVAIGESDSSIVVNGLLEFLSSTQPIGIGDTLLFNTILLDGVIENRTTINNIINVAELGSFIESVALLVILVLGLEGTFSQLPTGKSLRTN